MARIEGLEGRRLFAILQPDVTWGDDGYVDRHVDHSFLAATAGGILTSDSDYDPDDGNFSLITRFAADGTRDPAFHDIRPATGYSAAVDALGRIYVLTGDTDHPDQLRLARYAADGQADAAWGDGGGVAIDLNNTDARSVSLKRVSLTADGAVYPHIYFNSSVYDEEGGDFVGGDHDRVYKFDNSGRPDSGFGNGGRIDFFSGDDYDYGKFVWTGVQPDGRVIFIESGDYTTFITRYNADGSGDDTYGDYTDQDSPRIEGNLNEESIALDSDGRLIIAEQDYKDDPLSDSSASYYQVSRFTADGGLDPAFGNKGVFQVDNTAAYNGEAGIVLPQKNGKIVVRLGEQVLRLTADGKRDSGFAPGGAFDLDYRSDRIVGQLPDGSLLASSTANTHDEYTYSVAKLTRPPVAAQGKSGTVYLTGTDARETAILYAADRAGYTAIDYTTAGKAAETVGEFTGVTAVVADLGGGDNTFVSTYNAVPQTVLSGDGNDSIVTGAGDDSIDTGDGDDTVQSGGGYDSLDLGGGAANVDAGSGGGDIDLGTHNDERAIVRGQGGRWTVNGYGGRADIVLSGETADVYFDADRSSIFSLNMTGGATLTAGNGNDSITTGDGPDLIIPGQGNDTVSSGAGDDTVAGEDYDYYTSDTPSALDDTYDLGPGNDVARDGYGNNTIVGGDGDDSIRTGGGRDHLSGDLGRDTLRAGDGDDTLTGGGGRDRLYGHNGNDLITGGGNNDTLAGGPGSDTLFGGAGDDLLLAGDDNGPAVQNVLGGGAGVDRYRTENAGDLIDRVEEVYE